MVRKRKAPHLTTGEQGERAARRFLRLRGYRIVECNYLCPMGEIDIVARKGSMIVFAEVRTRQAGSLVDPVGSIDDLKLARMVDAARHYLTARRGFNLRCRFDIISVRTGGPARGRIRHYPDAFHITDERSARGIRLRSWLRRQPRFSLRAKPSDTEKR